MPSRPSSRTLARRAVLAGLVAAAFLAAGAVVSVGVAWSLRAYYQHHDGLGKDTVMTVTEGRRRWRIDTLTAVGRWSAINYPERPLLFGRAARPSTVEPVWAAAWRRDHPNSTVGGYGWPWLCLAHALDYGAPGRSSDISMYTTPNWLGPLGGLKLPLQPIWIGLAGDGVFYGAGLFALYATLGLGRRSIRRRRNLCPSCGYSREGLGAASACPECGNNTM